MKAVTDKEMKEAIESVKFGSKLEAKWTDTLEKTKEALMIDGMNMEISEAIVKIAERKILEEKEKLK